MNAGEVLNGKIATWVVMWSISSDKNQGFLRFSGNCSGLGYLRHTFCGGFATSRTYTTGGFKSLAASLPREHLTMFLGITATKQRY
jgi:hypothetical protein